jgi:hypothetical protein
MVYDRQNCVGLYSYCIVVLLAQYILKCFELHVGVFRRFKHAQFLSDMKLDRKEIKIVFNWSSYCLRINAMILCKCHWP